MRENGVIFHQLRELAAQYREAQNIMLSRAPQGEKK
jgi:hypothetical protein